MQQLYRLVNLYAPIGDAVMKLPDGYKSAYSAQLAAFDSKDSDISECTLLFSDSDYDFITKPPYCKCRVEFIRESLEDLHTLMDKIINHEYREIPYESKVREYIHAFYKQNKAIQWDRFITDFKSKKPCRRAERDLRRAEHNLQGPPSATCVKPSTTCGGASATCVFSKIRSCIFRHVGCMI